MFIKTVGYYDLGFKHYYEIWQNGSTETIKHQQDVAYIDRFFREAKKMNLPADEIDKYVLYCINHQLV